MMTNGCAYRVMVGGMVALIVAAGAAAVSAQRRGQSQERPEGRVIHSGGIINRASGKGLDVQDRSNRDGANIQQWDFASAANQMWDVIDQGNGRFAIINQGSGRALDVTNGRPENGVSIQQYRFAGGGNQLWRLERNGSFMQIVNVATRLCLDVDAGRINENGANVQQWSCARQPNQEWSFRQ